MNRKQRRVALKQTSPAGRAGEFAAELFTEAARCQQQNQLAEAARLYKRLLLLKPDHAEASNNLGCVLQAQGKLADASARFARSLALMPQLLQQYGNILATLVAVLPALGEALRKAMTVWPQRPTLNELFGTTALAAISGDPLLLHLLQAVPVRDVALERLLTALRVSLLDAAANNQPVSEVELTFCCALAQQCFINEYVFATTPAEDSRVDQLVTALHMALTTSHAIPSLWLAAIAMYQPLHRLAYARELLERSWPASVDAVLTRQLREPLVERTLDAEIPRLTPVDDEVSQKVRQQYEENPYPRWIDVADQVEPIELDAYLRVTFPNAAITPLASSETLETLVAGCGTGYHAISIAQKYRGVKVLAIDLSLASLAYAKRKTPTSLTSRLSYAQADIVKLGAIGRRFDLIDASGVLHHMAKPLEGWRILLGLLRPSGVMHLGLYSELGRRDVTAARAVIAERGYASTAADIRRCRQELLETPLRSLARFHDFFSTSECRDLLFHVQESRMTIPAIKDFIAAQGLRFIGFEFDPTRLQRFRALFAQNGWSMSDLDRWHALETEYPDTFAAMYNLWVQKP